MILEPGSFRVANYRKSMSWRVKCEAMMSYLRDISWERDALCLLSLSEIEFDHRPPLCDRPLDTVTGDFIPPQNDPRFIVPCAKREHLEKTTGRKADAAKTVTTRGSDVGERARTADIRVTQAHHRAHMERKAGNHAAADALLASVRPKRKHTKPKQRIKQRATPWPKRKFRV